jgi:hypothetical protein
MPSDELGLALDTGWEPKYRTGISESDFGIWIVVYIGGDSLGQGDDRKVSSPPLLQPQFRHDLPCLLGSDIGVLRKKPTLTRSSSLAPFCVHLFSPAFGILSLSITILALCSSLSLTATPLCRFALRQVRFLSLFDRIVHRPLLRFRLHPKVRRRRACTLRF